MRIALATCHEYPNLHPDDHLLVATMEERGWKVAIHDWESPAPPKCDALLMRSVWNYAQKPQDFQRWLSALDADNIRVINSTHTIRRNLRKRYLSELKGIKTVPTLWAKHGEHVDLEELPSQNGWIVKPDVGAGASGISRCKNREEVQNALRGPGELFLVQPFQQEITDLGEWSVMYFGNEFSHSVLKKPKDGDFRVQWRHGGTQSLETFPQELLPKTREVLQAWGENLVYARVDGIIHQGEFLLMELEVFEPFLFLLGNKKAALTLCDAIAASLK